MAWEDPVDIVTPPGCNPCRFCKGHCMEAEALEHDWHGRGRVVRIWPTCDASAKALPECRLGDATLVEGEMRRTLPVVAFDMDEQRTEFAPEAEAVAEWNRMNP